MAMYAALCHITCLHTASISINAHTMDKSGGKNSLPSYGIGDMEVQYGPNNLKGSCHPPNNPMGGTYVLQHTPIGML